MFVPPDEAAASIPVPEWKQFVLGKAEALSAQEESRRCALFWYKEKLIGGLGGPGRISASWKYVSVVAIICITREPVLFAVRKSSDAITEAFARHVQRTEDRGSIVFCFLEEIG